MPKMVKCSRTGFEAEIGTLEAQQFSTYTFPFIDHPVLLCRRGQKEFEEWMAAFLAGEKRIPEAPKPVDIAADRKKLDEEVLSSSLPVKPQAAKKKTSK